jgi:voltage-gated potassium channel
VDGLSGTDPGTDLPVTVPRGPLLLGLARILLTVVGLVVVYYLLPLERGFQAPSLLSLLAGLAGVALLVAWQVRSILRARHPALRAIEAVAMSLPLFLLLFAAAYVLLAGTDPGAFTQSLTRTDGIYFVVTVFATVGFGDISPVSETARVLVTLQMVGDLVLIGLVLRIFLVAVNHGRRHAAER